MSLRYALIAGLAVLLAISLAGLAAGLTDSAGPDGTVLSHLVWAVTAAAAAAALGVVATQGMKPVPSDDGDEIPQAIWREAMEASPLGMALYDTDGRLAASNNLWRDAIPEQQYPATLRDGEQRLPNGIWGRVRRETLSDGRTLFTLENLATHRLAAEEAAAARMTVRLIASAAGDWIWETDPLHRFAAATPVRDGIEQKEVDWMIGRDPGELAGWKAAQSITDRMARHLPLRAERLASSVAGHIQTIRLDGVPRFDANGAFMGYCGIGASEEAPDPQSVDIFEMAAAVAQPRPASRQILLVDDSTTNRMVGLAILKRMGYAAEAADDADAALAMLEKGDFGLVLMDVRMPGMDGLQATAAIRQLPEPLCFIPVVAMTAHVNEADRQRCLEAGMDAYVAKPIERAKLAAVLERYLGPAAGMDGPETGVEQAAAPLTDSLLDEAVLQQLRTDAGASLTSELIDAFMSETDERLPRMAAALKSGDLNALAAEAHAMKSSSGTFGAMQLQSAVTRLEAVAIQGDTTESADLMGKLPDLVAESWQAFGAAGYPHG